MAEFTEFMNNRVAHFFAMFKELRTGTITYPEIAKRENVRPPINKVCQKLGVKKVAQMTSDEKLLQAITAVVYDIEMKRRARLGANGEAGDQDGESNMDFDGEDAPQDRAPVKSAAPTEKVIFAPPGLTKAGPPATNIIGAAPAVGVAKPQPSFAHAQNVKYNEHTPQSQSTDSSVVGANGEDAYGTMTGLQRLPRAPPALQCDALDLLKVVLAVRSSNGRIQKAIQQVQQTSASPELQQLTTPYVQAVVKAVCMLIGCRRLDSTVSHEDTISAFDRYAKQSREGNSCSTLGSLLPTENAALTTEFKPVNAKPPVSATSSVYTSSLNITPPPPEGFASSPAGSGKINPFFPRGASSPMEIPASVQASRGRGASLSPVRPLNSPQSTTFKSTLQLDASTVSSPANTARSETHSSGPVVSESAPATPVPLDQVYSQFWELAYKLFLYVCNPYRHCNECLCVVEDIVNLLDRCPNLQSPLTALALDSVVQRAMYELSDKVSRTVDESVLKSISASTGCSASVLAEAASSPDCSVRNIEMCIALMSRSVSPVCLKIRDDYYSRNKLPPPSPGVVWCEKVLTLTRQLQELIAWSSPHCQARVPAYVPPGKQHFSATTKDTLFADRSLQDGDAGGPSTGVHTEPNVADYMSKLSPTSAGELLHALQAKDATLCDVLKQVGGTEVHAQLPADLESSIQLNLHRLIHQSISGDCNVSLCGSAVLGLSDANGKVKIDFAALATPYNTNFYDLSPEDQQMEIRRHEEITESLKSLEKAVEVDKLTEIAWKHLKACARDFHTQSQEFILKLTNKDAGQDQQGNGRGPYNNGPHGDHNGNGGYNNQRFPQQGHQQGQYGSPCGSHPSQGHNQHSPVPAPEVILAVAEDAESIRKAGESLVEKYFALRIDRINNAPVINQIMRKIEEMQETAEKSERERGNFVRKFSKSLDRVLKEHRYLYVRMVSNKARFTHVNFDYQISPQLQVSCNVIGCNPLPVQMTEFLYAYMALDSSGKVRDYLQTIKLFASAHHISDPASGFLSITAWYVMALHVLLRHNLLPNIHMHRLYPSAAPRTRARSYSDSSISTTQSTAAHAGPNTAPSAQQSRIPAAPAFTELPTEFRERLESTSLLVLLDLFFRYYVEQINLFTSVITLRDQGIVLPKTKWAANPVLWRISVEDPFEPIGSVKPYDLGCTLSRPGQLTTFKALRRAVYGIHSIMADTSSDCHENISRLFSKVELIHLARKSDYMGAVITASPAWVRPATKSVLDSAEYVQHTQTLHLSYDTEEGAQLLLPCMESGSEHNSPTSPNGKGFGARQDQNVVYGSLAAQQAAAHAQQVALSAKAPAFQPNWAPSPQMAGPVAAPVQMVGQQYYGQQQGRQLSPPPPMMNSPQMQYKQAVPAVLTMPPNAYGMPQQQPVMQAMNGYAYHPAAMYTQPVNAFGHPQMSQMAHTMQMPMQGAYGRPAPVMQGMNGYVQTMPQQRMYQEDMHAQHQQHMLPSGYAQAPVYGNAGQMRPQQHQQMSSHMSGQMAPQMSPQYPLHKQQQQYPVLDQRTQRQNNSMYSAQSSYNAGPHAASHAPQQQQQQQQQGRPFDPTAAALAAAAEARYPVGQLLSSQAYDPKGRKPEAPMSARQAAISGDNQYHQQGNVSARSENMSQYPPPDDRFGSGSGNVSSRTANETPRYHSSSEERFGSGSGTARTNTESPRYQSMEERYPRQQDMPQLSTGDRYHAGNLSARPNGETPRFTSMEDRYAKPSEMQQFTTEDRYHSAGNMSARMGHGSSVEKSRYPPAPAEERRYPVPGSLTARPSETSNRYAGDDRLTTGSLSARYPSVEERYPAQRPEVQTHAPAPVQESRVPRLDLDVERPTVSSRPAALAQSLKLDLQPKFAEERYALTSADPPVSSSARNAATTATAPGSARQEERAIVPPPINIGNLSARRTSAEFSTLVSPRTALSESARSSLLSSQNMSLHTSFGDEQFQKPHRSPLVPLIPLEGISSLNSSASGSESNAMYSDRSSLYMSTSRSDAFADTSRSTIVPAGAANGSVYGVPGTGRSTATHNQLPLTGLTGLGAAIYTSAPNTSRSVEFDLGHSADSGDDYKPFAATTSGALAGMSLTSRSRDEVFSLTDRSTEAQHTNRLGYMGLDDLRNRRTAGNPFLKGNNNTINEFDEMMERINSESRSNSVSQNSNCRSPLNGDFAAPNTARSGHSGHSGGSLRASNASIHIPQEVHEFGIFAASLTPRGLTPRRESIGSSSSGTGSGHGHSRTPVQGDLKTFTGSHSLLSEQLSGPAAQTAQVGSYSFGLTSHSGETSAASLSSTSGLTGITGSGSADEKKSSYLQMLFTGDSPAPSAELE